MCCVRSDLTLAWKASGCRSNGRSTDAKRAPLSSFPERVKHMFRRTYDSYEARWKNTPVAYFNGMGYNSKSDSSRGKSLKKAPLKTWREKSANLRREIRRDKKGKKREKSR
jgi:hypothetical protein